MSNRNRLLDLIILIISAIQCATILLNYSHGPLLGDLEVYSRAAYAYAHGGDPYKINEGNLFVYPPMTVRLLSHIGSKVEIAMLTLYVFVLFLMILWLNRNRRLTLSLIMSFSYLGYGLISLMSGNITFYIHLLLIMQLARLEFLRPNHSAFLATAVMAALIKPYFIAYTLIPGAIAIIMRTEPWRPIRSTIKSFIAFVFIFLMDYFYNPSVYVDFITNLKTQTLIRGDLGVWVYGYTYKEMGEIGALLLHCILAIIPFLFIWLRRSQIKEQGYPSAGFLLYFAITLTNPRLKEYDIPAMLISLFGWASQVIPEKAMKSLLIIFGLSGIIPYIGLSEIFHDNRTILYSAVVVSLVLIINIQKGSGMNKA